MVIHILKNGSTTTDISGIRIAKEDFIAVYRIAEGINRRNESLRTSEKSTCGNE